MQEVSKKTVASVLRCADVQVLASNYWPFPIRDFRTFTSILLLLLGLRLVLLLLLFVVVVMVVMVVVCPLSFHELHPFSSWWHSV